MRKSSLVALGYSLVSLLSSAEGAITRPASETEVIQLFDLAMAGPQRIRIVADIKFVEPAWTPEQVAAEVKHQTEILKEDERSFSEKKKLELLTLRSNAIARTHSGTRVFRVQEWYSGNYYRLDRTDENAAEPSSLLSGSNSFNDTFVNLHDPNFSPYMSFSAKHGIRSAMLSKEAGRRFASHDLWRVTGLDQEVMFPLIIAFLDHRSVRAELAHAPGSDRDLSSFKADPVKVERIRNRSDPSWSLEATDEVPNAVRLKLEGSYPAPESPMPLSSIRVTYLIATIAKRTVCLEATITNLTHRTSFSSKREQFDRNGIPRLWKTLKYGKDSSVERHVMLKEIDNNPTFTDQEVFLPVFPTNYLVSDITSGRSVLLQNPRPDLMARSPLPPSPIRHRTLLVVLLLTVGILPVGLYYALKRR